VRNSTTTKSRRSRPPLSRRSRSPEAKQRQLLDAARELFAELGYEATSTFQIARRAGVSEGILFHHFGSKRGLFARLAEDYGENALQSAVAVVAGESTAELALRGAFAFAEQDPALFRLFVEDEVLLEKLEITTARAVLVRSIQEALERNMEAGNARQGDPRIMAELQFDVVISLYRAWRRSGDPSRKEDYIAEGIRCLAAIEDSPPSAAPGKAKRTKRK
jgi:AcrR family transcriptional regulator